MVAAAGTQHFGAVFFQRDVAGGSGDFLAHHVGGAESGESLPDGHLSDALLRGVQNKPADEREPEAILNGTMERSPGARKNHRVGDQLSTRARDARGLLEIFRDSPDHGSKNSSTVQGKSRQQTENGQRENSPREPRVHA